MLETLTIYFNKVFMSKLNLNIFEIQYIRFIDYFTVLYFKSILNILIWVLCEENSRTGILLLNFFINIVIFNNPNNSLDTLTKLLNKLIFTLCFFV
eukprot:403345279